MFNLFKKEKRKIATFLNTGFHGDKVIHKILDPLFEKCEYFIETGTNVGSTLAFVASRYPNIKCFSCEPHKESYKAATANTANFENVKIFNTDSLNFMKELEQINFQGKKVVSWLDAHGYGFEWPLKEEVEFFTSNKFESIAVMIDDFQVPEIEEFKWDKYNGQECTLDFIKDSINKERSFHFYYPNYSEKTSTVHPLTGWCVMDFNYGVKKALTPELSNKLKESNVF
jgi:hypothetical protein